MARITPAEQEVIADKLELLVRRLGAGDPALRQVAGNLRAEVKRLRRIASYERGDAGGRR